MSRWLEIIEGKDERLSSANTGFMIVVLALTFCTVFMTVMKAYMEAVSMAGILATAAGITKAAAKWNDSSVEKAAYNPPPEKPEPAQGVNINVGQQQEGKGEGDVLNTQKIVTKSLVVGGKKGKK